MSVELFYGQTLADETAIPELSVVELTRSLDARDGSPVPAGAQGTVVGTWARGAAYEVEFEEPRHALLTVRAEDLREVTRFAG